MSWCIFRFRIRAYKWWHVYFFSVPEVTEETHEMDVKIDAAGTVVHVDINDFTITECNCEFIITRYCEFHETCLQLYYSFSIPFCECFSLCRVYFRNRARLSALFEFDKSGFIFLKVYIAFIAETRLFFMLLIVMPWVLFFKSTIPSNSAWRQMPFLGNLPSEKVIGYRNRNAF